MAVSLAGTTLFSLPPRQLFICLCSSYHFTTRAFSCNFLSFQYISFLGWGIVLGIKPRQVLCLGMLYPSFCGSVLCFRTVLLRSYIHLQWFYLNGFQSIHRHSAPQSILEHFITQQEMLVITPPSPASALSNKESILYFETRSSRVCQFWPFIYLLGILCGLHDGGDFLYLAGRWEFISAFIE